MELVPIFFPDFCRALDSRIVKYGKGFLRCAPSQWFPNFHTEWFPLFQSLNAEVKVTEIKPVLKIEESIEIGYTGVINGESCAIYVDSEGARILLHMLVPGSLQEGKDCVLEYLARRFFAVLSSQWKILHPEAQISFNNKTDPFSLKVEGAVKISLFINGAPLVLWVGMEKGLVEQLNDFWVKSSKAQSHPVGEDSEGGEATVNLELVQLAVAPSELVSYSRSGTVVDLEIPVNDRVIVREGLTGITYARLRTIDGNFALESLPGSIPKNELPDGMTRVTLSLGSISISRAELNDSVRAGTSWSTGIAIHNRVQVMVNGEKIAEAELFNYEGRFAMGIV